LIDGQKATGRVKEDRVHLAGFSAGSVLVYSIVATPGFPHAIDSVVTVSGAFGIINANRPEAGFLVKQIHEGAPVDALLVQGGQDPAVPAAGGLDESGRRVHVSFRTKVDYWRLATGTESTPPEPVDVRALVPDAPADLVAVRYSNDGSTVVEILDPGLGHAWPEWNLMAVAAELFEK
jgi:poly(3-hydroxybutyrate) depolymerase